MRLYTALLLAAVFLALCGLGNYAAGQAGLAPWEKGSGGKAQVTQ